MLSPRGYTLGGSDPYNLRCCCQWPAKRATKRLKFALFFLFHLKMNKIFRKFAFFFTFGKKQSFYLTHSTWEFFENLVFTKKKQKNATLNSLISKARANSESKLIFSESPFNFLKNRVVFCTLYPPGYSAVLLPLTRRAQRVNDQAVKDLNLLFFIYFIWKWGEIFEKLHFFTFRPNQCFYLTHSAREYFVKLAFKKNKKYNFNQLYLKS